MRATTHNSVAVPASFSEGLAGGDGFITLLLLKPDAFNAPPGRSLIPSGPRCTGVPRPRLWRQLAVVVVKVFVEPTVEGMVIDSLSMRRPS